MFTNAGAFSSMFTLNVGSSALSWNHSLSSFQYMQSPLLLLKKSHSFGEQ